MRWNGQELDATDADALPGLEHLSGLVRSVTTPEFAGMTFHEVLARSALNHVPQTSAMPFDWTVNPYRGCSHACRYCLSPDTMVLMADGRHRPLGSLMVGDEIVGTERFGHYRRYVRTRVLARWATRKPAYQVTLADGTELVASADHRFLTQRGWKHVTGAMGGALQRPYLTTNDRLMGFGQVPTSEADTSESFRRGYLTGMIRGDGMLLHKSYTDDRRTREIHRFRLALADLEALDRAQRLLSEEGIATSRRPFTPASATRREMTAIHTAKRADVAMIEQIIAYPQELEHAWAAGFLSGVFDAEGSCSRGVLRISNNNEDMLRAITRSMSLLDVPHVREPANAIGVAQVRVIGGLPERERFFALTKPAITRKLQIDGTAVKSVADLRVTAVESLGRTIDMIDITTGTGDFIANGIISHNCFARGTHEYLDLDAGNDFDSQIVVKVNVADILRRELARGSWQHEHVALGTNTDPYQRAEGRYRLMPEIVSALTDSGTPFSILTKGTLLRRDLPLLRDAASTVDVSLAMSIAIFDDALQHSIEPGTPTAQARLDTVRAATDAGFAVTVFLMPILPHLTDSIPALDDSLRRIRDAGAARVVFGALHLRPGVKPWFQQWLAREHPELLSSYRALYPGAAAQAPKAYRSWLAKRVRPLVRRYGLDGRLEEEQPRFRPPRPGPVIRTGRRGVDAGTPGGEATSRLF